MILIWKWLKEYYGAVFIIAVLVFMFLVTYIFDPKGTPGGSFLD